MLLMEPEILKLVSPRGIVLLNEFPLEVAGLGAYFKDLPFTIKLAAAG